MVFTSLLFLALWQPSLRVQEQKTQTKGQAQEANQTKTPTESPSAKSSGVVSQPGTEGDKKKTGQHFRYVHDLFSSTNLPNLLLVLVGGAGLYFAWNTLKVIAVQTEATKKAAEAAKTSADALMDIERPWLLVIGPQFSNLPRENQEKGQPFQYVATFAFNVKNYGRSPAWLIACGGTFNTIATPIDLPLEPTYKNHQEVELRGVVVTPSEESPAIRIPHSEDTTISNDDWRQVSEGQKALYVCGFLQYRDAFKRSHETRFCYLWSVTSHSFISFDNPPLYTRHT